MHVHTGACTSTWLSGLSCARLPASTCVYRRVFLLNTRRWTLSWARARMHAWMCECARSGRLRCCCWKPPPLSLSLSLIFLPAASPPLQFQYRPPSRSISALHPPSPSSSSPSSSSSALAPLPLQVDGGWEPRRQKPWPGCAAGRARWC